jgi:phosphoenolpyruvate-protein phosphotransferase
MKMLKNKIKSNNYNGQWLSGIPISPGLAQGKAFIYHDILHLEHDYYSIRRKDVKTEYERILGAFEAVKIDLEKAFHRAEQELDSEFSAIFRVQIELLKDATLLSDLLEELENELVNAELVVKTVFRRFENKLRSAKYAFMAERGDDIADLARRTLRELSGFRAHSLENLPKGTVLVAHRLLPSDTVFLPQNSVAAAIVEVGGPASHMAILAREMGTPAVSEIDNIVSWLKPDTKVLVDGMKGRVCINPNEKESALFDERINGQRAIFRKAKKACKEKAITKDGSEVRVFANIGSREDALLAADNGAEGIGLYRLEKLFLAKKSLPTTEELEEELDETLAILEGMSVTMRLLDVGGDKILPSIDSPTETNPALGRRGIRLLLSFEELLDTQLRVLLRLSQRYDIRILAPMVTVTDDMALLRDYVEKTADELGCSVPPLGAMIETPAAALCAKDISRYADFFSFGTNDLTQYTMAAGRENSYVANYFVESHPAVLRLMQLAIEAAIDLPFEVCGELASSIESLPKILKTGIRQLSVAPLAVPVVKEGIRRLSLS